MKEILGVIFFQYARCTVKVQFRTTDIYNKQVRDLWSSLVLLRTWYVQVRSFYFYDVLFQTCMLCVWQTQRL